jgi:hypothetical protein
MQNLRMSAKVVLRRPESDPFHYLTNHLFAAETEYKAIETATDARKNMRRRWEDGDARATADCPIPVKVKQFLISLLIR